MLYDWLPRSLKNDWIGGVDALNKFGAWLKAFDGSVPVAVLEGPSGSGKTTVIKAAARKCGYVVRSFDAEESSTKKFVKDLKLITTSRHLLFKPLILLEDFDKFSGVSLKAIENCNVPIVCTTTRLFKIANYKDIINRYCVVKTKAFKEVDILRRLNQVVPDNQTNSEIASLAEGDLSWAISQVEFESRHQATHGRLATHGTTSRVNVDPLKLNNVKDLHFDSIFDTFDSACKNPSLDNCLSANSCDRNGVYKLVFENYPSNVKSVEDIAVIAEGMSVCDVVSCGHPAVDSSETDIIGIHGLYEPVVRAGKRNWLGLVYSQVDNKSSTINKNVKQLGNAYLSMGNVFDPDHFQEFQSMIVRMCEVDTAQVQDVTDDFLRMGLTWDHVARILSLKYFRSKIPVSDHRRQVLKGAFERSRVKRRPGVSMLD